MIKVTFAIFVIISMFEIFSMFEIIVIIGSAAPRPWTPQSWASHRSPGPSRQRIPPPPLWEKIDNHKKDDGQHCKRLWSWKIIKEMVILKNYGKYDGNNDKMVVLKNYDKDDGLGPCWKRSRYIEKDSQLLRQQCATIGRGEEIIKNKIRRHFSFI